MMLSWPLYGVFELVGRNGRLLLERLEFAVNYIPYPSLKAVIAVRLLEKMHFLLHTGVEGTVSWRMALLLSAGFPWKSLIL